MSEETQVLAADAVAQETAVLENEQNTSTEQAAEENTQQEPEGNAETEEHKRKGGWQRKIEKQQRLLEEQARQIAFLRGKAGLDLEQPGPAETPKPEKPVRDKFESDEEYHLALGRYGAQEELRQQEAARKQQEAGKPLVEAINKAAQELEDFHDVVGPFIQSQPRSPFVDAYLSDPTIGPYLAYHLATNEAELPKLNGMTPSQLAKAIVELEPKFLKTTPAVTSVSTTKAPPPPNTGGKSSSSAVKDPYRDDMSPQEFREWRARNSG